MHWSDKIAQEIIRRRPDKEEYVCAAGISPSGSIHIMEGVEEQNITGEYKDGVLRLNLPKHVEQPRSNTRRIELQ